jgi:hypothetical protein
MGKISPGPVAPTRVDSMGGKNGTRSGQSLRPTVGLPPRVADPNGAAAAIAAGNAERSRVIAEVVRQQNINAGKAS